MGKQRWLSAATLVALLAVLYIPLVRVAINAFNSNSLGTSWGGATTKWFSMAWHNEQVRNSIATSAMLAIAASALSVLLGTGLVVGMRSLPRGVVVLGRMSAVARITTPEIILATGLFILMPILGIRFGFGALMIGHVVFLTSFVVLLVGARATNADHGIEEAASDLGAGPFRVLWSIVLPDLLPAIAAAALLAAAFSFDDVALSRSLASPDTTTLPMLLVSMILRKATPEIDAIATMLLLVGGVLFIIALLVGRSLSVLTAEPDRRVPEPVE